MFLGYRLKQLRKTHAMSQEELGKMLGVSKVSISGYEKGTRMPSMNVLLTILSLFDVSADYMLGRDLNAVCEDGETTILISRNDVNIIKNLHSKPELYNIIAKNPKRFLDSINKK